MKAFLVGVLGVFLVGSLTFSAEFVNTGRWSDVAVYGIDVVAYFTESKPVKGSEMYSTSWRGAEWYFSNVAHLKLFESDPEKYAPQYGGWCAYAMAKGKKAKIDPEVWEIYQGKLYLNYNAKVGERWAGDKDDYIMAADERWGGLIDMK